LIAGCTFSICYFEWFIKKYKIGNNLIGIIKYFRLAHIFTSRMELHRARGDETGGWRLGVIIRLSLSSFFAFFFNAINKKYQE